MFGLVQDGIVVGVNSYGFDGQNGEVIEFPEIKAGQIWDGSSLSYPQKTKEERIIDLKNQMIIDRNSPILWDGSLFDVNGGDEGFNNLEGAYSDFSGAIDAANKAGMNTNGGTTIPWALSDDTERDMTKEQIQKVISDIRARRAELHYKYRADKSEITNE